jgi:hypothetical protein
MMYRTQRAEGLAALSIREQFAVKAADKMMALSHSIWEKTTLFGGVDGSQLHVQVVAISKALWIM